MESFVELLKDGKLFDLFHKIYSESIDLSTQLDQNGSTALHIVTKDASITKAYHLLRHNNSKCSFINLTDNMGRTALHWAALKGNPSLIHLLIHYKVDLSIKDNDGNTPLHLVCKSKDIVSFSLLLEAANSFKQEILSLKNNRKQTFHNLFSTPLQIQIYKRFINLNTSHNHHFKTLLKQLIVKAKKDQKLFAALVAINDIETISVILSDNSETNNFNPGTIDFIPGSQMRSVLKHNPDDKLIQIQKYSGLKVNDAILSHFFTGNLYLIHSDELLKGIDGSGFSLFNLACTELSKKILEELLNQMKDELLVNTSQFLSCSNIDILNRFHPTLAAKIHKLLPQRYALSNQLLKDHDECPICREPNCFGDIWIKLKCIHKFHKNCLDIWTKKQWNCPMCRRTIDMSGGLIKNYQ